MITTYEEGNMTDTVADFSYPRQLMMEAIVAVSDAAQRPSVLYRPALSRVEIGWTATYGDVVGRGGSPEKAMADFDKAWGEDTYERKPAAWRP